eukprot:953449-Prymnesium_polylepis.1
MLLVGLSPLAALRPPRTPWSNRICAPRAALFCSDAADRLPRLEEQPLPRAPRLDAELLSSATAAAVTGADDAISALTKVAPYFRQRLRELTRPAAVALVPVLSTENALGYVNKVPSKGRGGTLVDYAAREKERHPEKVLLIKVGEFYESFGVDALMLVQHAALNPMGS